MYLRKLKNEDAPLMLEWMHDASVTENLAANFASKTLEDCERFILASQDTSRDLHLAITTDEDEYMGTVSLKHVDKEHANAEFAISVRKVTMGKGYAWQAMVEIIRIAFEELGLKQVYWCVSAKNSRACRFYDKHGFRRVTDMPGYILERYAQEKDLRWYSVVRGDNYHNPALSKGEVAGCRIVTVKSIPAENAGQLSFFEATRDIPFEIKRIYYISNVPEGVRRGYHAHKTLKQLLFCPYGKIQIILDTGSEREEITLDDPSIGILIDRPIWREMLWLEKNSVLCVAASDYYKAEDYIRDYDAFLKYKQEEHT